MYNEWIKMLLNIELFKNIEQEELNKILYCSNPNIKLYKKNEIITIEKSEFTGIGIVLKGEVIITKETMAGDRMIMARIKKGDIFGEITAFVNNKWLETIIADTDSTILFLSPNRIVGMCPHMCIGHRILIQNTLKIVSEKALMLHKKVELLSLKSIRKKISTYLLEQYFMGKNLLFKIPLKRNELAEYLFVSRPSLSRELINMQQEGLIDFHRNSFKILDLEALKNCL